MNTSGAGHLGNATNIIFHIAGGEQHNVGQFVDDKEDIGHVGKASNFMIRLDIFGLDLGKEFVAAVHFGGGPL